MMEAVYRVICASLYKRHKFRMFNKVDPSKKLRNRMYYRKHRAQIKAHRKLFRLKNKAHERLRKQVHSVTPLWLPNSYGKPYSSPKPASSRHTQGQHTSIPKTHKIRFRRSSHA